VPGSVLHQIQYAVKQGCARLRNALKCISEAMFTVTKSRVKCHDLCGHAPYRRGEKLICLVEQV